MENPLAEDPALFGSSFGFNSTANKPPPKWEDALRIHATKIRRIGLGWKGSNAQKNFDEIPGALWEVPELDTKEKPEDRTDDRHDGDEGLKKWAHDWLIKLWSTGNAQADRNGPGIAQMRLFGWGEKGYFDLKGGAIAAKCGEQAGSGDVVDVADMSAAKILAWTVVEQRKTIERLEKRCDSYALNAEKPIIAIGRAVDAATNLHEKALAVREKSSESAAKERAEERKWLLDILRANMSGESWGKAIDKLGPLLEMIFGDVVLGGVGSKPDYVKMAKVLRESITTEQVEQAKALGLIDLIEDIQNSMRAIEKAENADEAKAIINPLSHKVIAEQEILKQVLTGGQLQIALSLFKFAGAGS